MKDLQDLLKDKVAKYEFEPLFDDSIAKEEFRDFEFKTLKKDQVIDIQEHERVIRKERSNATKSSFAIAPIVREHRGMNRQEELEKQRLIQEEVERQLIRIQEQAYKEGFEKGLKDGKEEVFNETRAGVEQKLEALGEMVEVALQTQYELLNRERTGVHKTIKNLTKWVILKELKDDGDYVIRLLEKLISELQVKNNLLIQIDPKSFAEMPDILELVQERIGGLKNVRMECDYDIEGPGIIIESDNGIINGTLKEQFASLNKLFESVGLVEEDNFRAEDFYETSDINDQAAGVSPSTELKSTQIDSEKDDSDKGEDGDS
jgi:flagellar assembly protein FliH